MTSLHAIYASTSGHTEYVIGVLAGYVENSTRLGEVSAKRSEVARSRKSQITRQRVENAVPEDLLKGGVLLLASGTWNTGGIEGQLNPHMHAFLNKKAADVDLKGGKCAVIGLGDERYRYTCRAADHLEQWVKAHGGELACESLQIVNEPYGQEERVREWTETLLVTCLL